MTTITKLGPGHYRYRNGEPATVLTVDRQNTASPVVAMTSQGVLTFHNANGIGSNFCGLDLIPIPRKVWVPLAFHTGSRTSVFGHFFPTEEEARRHAHGCIACVEIELPEGES